ncbi:arsenic resistance protein [Brevibacterium atlanticum]|uniref:arsenic resistance protein n=1 Tax=Brevibacterium atlanticum TaxID=2697563 RepID=UPI0014227C84|nr:bile acid:sodium symporter [Brevibacterium atlanticum]
MATSSKVIWWVAGLALGLVAGSVVPGVGPAAEWALTPCLIVLLFLTFLDLPFEGAVKAFGDLRFLAAVVGANFLVVPLVVAGLVTVVDLGDLVDFPEPMLLAVLVVLLCPCIDYVIVFTRAVDGRAEKLLALTPVLMIAQLLVLPVSIWAITGGRLSAALPVGPLVSALMLFIIIPLLAAIVVRLAARRSGRVQSGVDAASSLVDLVMTLTLLVIAASVAPLIGGSMSHLGGVVLVFVVFAVIMVGLGWVVARWMRLEAGSSRAVVLSAVTRNSLVVLPIVRAATGDGIGPAAVVAQTLVEVLFLLVLTRFLPKLIPDTAVSENR